jgi:hypothetical protein
VSSVVELGAGSAPSLQPTQSACVGASSSLDLLGIAVFVLIIGGPIFSAIWLGVTANRVPTGEPRRFSRPFHGISRKPA